MKISLIQMHPKLLDISYNHQRSLEWIEKATGDVVLLPELYLSGYTFKHNDEVWDSAMILDKDPMLTDLKASARSVL